MMRKDSLLLVCMLLSIHMPFLINGQTKPLFYTIESPNAAGLRASLETPVSLEAGKVSANIPIYEVRDKDLSLPIGLSYNTSGVKPDVHPGWIGQGWNLSLGAVTRVIKGAPDELYWREDNVITLPGDNVWTNVYPHGYAFHPNINISPQWNSVDTIKKLAKDGSAPDTYWKDAEPDEFYFNCGDLSGSFFIGPAGEIIVQGRSDIKVEADIIYNIPLGFDPSLPLDPNNPVSFTTVSIFPSYYTFTRTRIAKIMGFRITGPDGKVYTFGQYDIPYDESNNFDEMEFTANVHDQYYASEVFTSWYMTKITSAITNGEIKLKYGRGSPILSLGVGFSFYKMGGTAPAKGFWGWLFGGASAYVEEAKSEVDGKFIRPTYLKSIETSEVKVEFNTSTSTELKYNYDHQVLSLLDKADYYDPNLIAPSLYSRPMIGQIIDYIEAPYLRPTYSYVHSAIGEQYIIVRKDGYVEFLDFGKLKWAKLDNIRISNRKGNNFRDINFEYSSSTSQRLQLQSLMDSDVGSPYLFTYNTSSTLPGYLSMLIDHWGYFNNVNAFIGLDLQNTSTLDGYKDFRSSVSSYLYAGMLNKITFPTKGYKEFIYEPNSYRKLVLRDSLTGAFSTSLPSPMPIEGGGLRIRQIKEVAGVGMPEMLTTYEYSDGLLNGDVQYYWPQYRGMLFNGNDYYSDRFVTESLMPTIRHSAGGEIAYSKVTEKRTGAGRTEYEFISFADNPDVHGISIDPHKSVYAPFTRMDFARGQLKEKRIYEEGRTLPVVKENYLYRFNPGLYGRSIRAVQSRALRLFGSTEVNAIEGTSYEHKNYPYQLWKKQTQLLDTSNNIYHLTSEEFEFDNSVLANDNQLKKHTLINGTTGESILHSFKHTWDYTTGSLGSSYAEAAGLTGLFDKRIVNRVISKSMAKKKTATADYEVIAADIDLYKIVNNRPLIHKSYGLELASPVLSYTDYFSSSTYSIDSKFKEKISYEKYDNYGNLTDVLIDSVRRESFLWADKAQQPYGIATNSASDEFLVMTADEDGNYISNYDPHWSIDDFVIPDPQFGWVLDVENSYGLFFFETKMIAGKVYELTYWGKNSDFGELIYGSVTIISDEILEQRGDWKKRKIRMVSSNNSTLFVDSWYGLVYDVIFAPEEAQVSTAFYRPLQGLTRKTDTRGFTERYIYDNNNRLKHVMDDNNQYLRSYEYQYRTP